MRVLSLVHGPDARSGIFGEAVRDAGHELDERSYPLGRVPDPVETYDALIVLGGSMNVHEIDGHPWILEEQRTIAGALEAGVPVLGVCLGGQLLGAVAGGRVHRAPRPEIGWFEVATSDAASEDALFAGLPPRFLAYQWHSYCVEPPDEAVVLATSSVCVQALRLGESAWATQFHAEVTAPIVERWIANYRTDPDAVALGFDPERERRRLHEEIGRWNELGRELVGGFLAAAARRAGIPPQASPA
ncbi:MAG: type 1 glutamine amidotransferase [Thermoleophilia bacterium]|nr:type 1 glutamine amidotransferase [Thermoleophilia bacterium]